jgi:hypothetical protein
VCFRRNLKWVYHSVKMIYQEELQVDLIYEKIQNFYYILAISNVFIFFLR